MYDTAQIPSIRDHVDVQSIQFAPCLSLRTQVQTILQVQSHLDDHGLYRSIALSVGTHIRWLLLNELDVQDDYFRT